MIKNTDKHAVTEIQESYVVDGDGDIVMYTRIKTQGNGIMIDLNSCGDHSKKVFTTKDIRDLINELDRIADLAEELY